ncbi:MAG: rod shape-determining protein MreC [Woeseiaceae bacterium]|nr:rod shape-determining protein MreC [Woeseiaceae bacterium]
MVASRDSSNNPGRVPALGLRVLGLIFISILLMYFDNRDNHLDTVRKGIGAAIYPLRVIVDAPVRFWHWLDESTTSRSDLEQELGRLNSERLVTSARLQKLNALEAENARLRELLDARAQVRDRARVAEIMSVDANPYSHSLVIDVGTQDGVFDGQALIDADGVVGQVIEAGLMTSQAMLISDTDHALPVEVNRNGLRTIVVGTGRIDSLQLPFVVNNADIRVGDLLVTSGLGGVFPAGYPVAIVESVTRLPHEPYAEVTATPAAALGRVREVMLIFSADATNSEAAVDE